VARAFPSHGTLHIVRCDALRSIRLGILEDVVVAHHAVPEDGWYPLYSCQGTERSTNPQKRKVRATAKEQTASTLHTQPQALKLGSVRLSLVGFFA
jgi:hypothetical protein